MIPSSRYASNEWDTIRHHHHRSCVIVLINSNLNFVCFILQLLARCQLANNIFEHTRRIFKCSRAPRRYYDARYQISLAAYNGSRMDSRSVRFIVGTSEILSFILELTFSGFSEKIPGYPRYSMIGDRGYGTFNLRIQNASLDDDAEFQCQVGPAKNSDPIRTAANLTVICEYQSQSNRKLRQPQMKYTDH